VDAGQLVGGRGASVIQVKVLPGNGKSPPERRAGHSRLTAENLPRAIRGESIRTDPPPRPAIDWPRVVGYTVAGILLGAFWGWLIGKLL
jgi:hypothetical protein